MASPDFRAADAVICGVDEAGRGPLAGAVFAAAVILAPRTRINGLADSKVLSEAMREKLAIRIQKRAAAWAVARAEVAEIDTINILRASLLAMKRAVEALDVAPTEVWADGLHCPPVTCRARAIVKGDARVPEISAASILAKTARDAYMRELHRAFPLYGFDRHKGYATQEHMEALHAHGACPFHRTSFAPVRVAMGLETVQHTLIFDET